MENPFAGPLPAALLEVSRGEAKRRRRMCSVLAVFPTLQQEAMQRDREEVARLSRGLQPQQPLLLPASAYQSPTAAARPRHPPGPLASGPEPPLASGAQPPPAKKQREAAVPPGTSPAQPGAKTKEQKHKLPPPSYICHICVQAGHWIKDCPLKEERDAASKADSSKPSEPAKSSQPCSFYLKGGCHKGADCRFSHSVPTLVQNEVCRFFLAGSCLKGEACPFSHNLMLLPCRYFHTIGCNVANCRFSHASLSGDAQARLVHDLERYEARIKNEVGLSDPALNTPTDEPESTEESLRKRDLTAFLASAAARAASVNIFASELPPQEASAGSAPQPLKKTHRFLQPLPQTPPADSTHSESIPNSVAKGAEMAGSKADGSSSSGKSRADGSSSAVHETRSRSPEETAPVPVSFVPYDPDAGAASEWQPPSYLSAQSDVWEEEEEGEEANNDSGGNVGSAQDGGGEKQEMAQEVALHPMRALLAARAKHRQQQRLAQQQKREKQKQEDVHAFDVPGTAPSTTGTFDYNPHPGQTGRGERGPELAGQSLEAEFLQKDPTSSPFL